MAFPWLFGIINLEPFSGIDNFLIRRNEQSLEAKKTLGNQMGSKAIPTWANKICRWEFTFSFFLHWYEYESFNHHVDVCVVCFFFGGGGPKGVLLQQLCHTCHVLSKLVPQKNSASPKKMLNGKHFWAFLDYHSPVSSCSSLWSVFFGFFR